MEEWDEGEFIRKKRIQAEWNEAANRNKSIYKLITSIHPSTKPDFSGSTSTMYYVQIIRQTHPSKNSLWLDVCCGSGEASFILAINHSCKVISFDVSFDRVRQGNISQKKLSLKNIEFINADLFHLPFKESIFDGAITIQSLSDYILEEQKNALKNIFSILRKKGLLILSDANKGPSVYNLLGMKTYAELLREIGFTILEAKEWGQRIFYILDKIRHKFIVLVLPKIPNLFLYKMYLIYTKFIFKIGNFENHFPNKNGVLFHILAKK